MQTTFDSHGARAATFDESGALSLWDLRESRLLWTNTGIPPTVPYRDSDDELRKARNVSRLEFNREETAIRVTATQGGGTWHSVSLPDLTD